MKPKKILKTIRRR